ncbi:MAG: thioredoxin domain-containing protein [Myxococcota bacterium]
MKRLLTLLAALAPTAAYAADGGTGTTIAAGMAALVLVCAVLVAVKPRVGAVASALAGIGVAGWLVAQHHAAKSGVASTCNISDAWNCDVVNTSQWSEVAGIPVALLGVGFYAAAAFLAVRYLVGQAPRAPGLLVLLSLAAVAVDVFLGLQMLKMKTGCVLCLTTYGLNLALLVASFRLAKEMDVGIGAAVGESFGKDGINAAIVGLAVVVLGGMAFRGEERASVVPTRDDGPVDVAQLSVLYEAVPGRVEVDGTEPVYGDPAAKITIVEWADFQCPHCAVMYKELHQVLEHYRDVKLVYKNYPISSLCNRFVDREGHTEACNAAAAGRCAGKQGRFWELSGKMFANQEYLSKDDIRFMARELSLDMPSFEACMGDKATADSVVRDIEAGGAAGVEGTPAIFVHGLWGDQWARLHGGGQELSLLLEAHKRGEALPAPPPPQPR